MVERSSSPRVISTGSVIPATPRTMTPRTSTERRVLQTLVCFISCLRPQPVTEPIREHLVLAFEFWSMEPNMPSQRAPERPGEHFGRHFYINDPNAVAKSADSIFGCGQGLRVAMHAAYRGRSVSKFRTVGSSSGSPQPQHRSEYRSLAVMRSAHTA